MSNKSDSGSEDTSTLNGSSRRRADGDHYEDDVCRDYMRNVCNRGKRCRYRHPSTDDRPNPSPRKDLTFCHDYQNNGCTRPNCKFLHCTRFEEEYFHRTGLLPSRLNYSNLTPFGALKSDIPLCRDYLNGECKRGSLCKYRHASDNSPVEYERRCERYYDYVPEVKRRRVEDEYETGRSVISYMLLDEEVTMLKRKVEELKKQVSDLTAINEVLLEQNARYRVSKVTAALQVPANQQALPTVAINAAVNTAHAQASMSQLNPSLTQQVALNSDLATQHAIAAQRLAAAGGGMAQTRSAQTAMAVTPTVTITQNVASALALTQSNIAVSMASMPQLQVAHSLTQNLGAPSTTLVSYPIMSHNMRSAVEPRSLTH
ncbi:unnamed protein product [Candidula unifasciata]|uniref:C3H1-type domain-containing protein n=1 Tax=Candidula unifasciata TaxID=100452 RepID=A0A8S3ZR49_9EUPU|nr:unnamed protein product [Candidula unifasciata]